ncbi:hypothetical protein D3C87_2115220 [compost metagenome]
MVASIKAKVDFGICQEAVDLRLLFDGGADMRVEAELEAEFIFDQLAGLANHADKAAPA